MNHLIKVSLLFLIFLLGQTTFAGPGHGHSHDHSKDNSKDPRYIAISSEQAVHKATKHIQSLIENGKINASWSGVALKSVEKKSYENGPEWVVTFDNKSAEDHEKQTLYIFYTLNGKYLASNFTGQ